MFAIISTSLSPIFFIVALFVNPNNPTKLVSGLFIYKLEIVKPKPSNVPLKLFVLSPIGLNPSYPPLPLLFQVEVALASILLPNSYFPFSA